MIPGITTQFYEEQHFSRWWLLIGIEPLLIFGILGIVKVIPFSVVISVVAITMIAPTLLMISSLETAITNDAIMLRFKPFKWKWKTIPLTDITSAVVRKYEPLGEFGGWGIKYGGKKAGWCYNAKGNIGLQLELIDGKKLLIGTQKRDELESVIKSLPIAKTA